MESRYPQALLSRGRAARCLLFMLTTALLVTSLHSEGEFLEVKEPLKAVALYDAFPCAEPPSFDDGYIHGEAVRLILKAKAFGDDRLERHLIGLGLVNGFNSLNKEIHILDEQFKFSKMLMRVYAAINKTSVQDPELQDFFKIKCWI